MDKIQYTTFLDYVTNENLYSYYRKWGFTKRSCSFCTWFSLWFYRQIRFQFQSQYSHGRYFIHSIFHCLTFQQYSGFSWLESPKYIKTRKRLNATKITKLMEIMNLVGLWSESHDIRIILSFSSNISHFGSLIYWDFVLVQHQHHWTNSISTFYSYTQHEPK